MSCLFALMAKTTQLEHSNFRYLSKGKICRAILMATLLLLTETKAMLLMPNWKSKMHNQNNTTWRFQLEHNIVPFNQDSLSISNFYHQFMNLWTEYTNIIYASLTSEGLSSVQIVHETTIRDQFPMNLRYDFESVRSNLMYKDPIPSLDACLNDLLREKQHLLTQSSLKNKNHPFFLWHI
ncbi:hypothetical protein CR513_55898, partial [Mucuna pruriens]